MSVQTSRGNNFPAPTSRPHLEELNRFTEALNEKLRLAGASGAEQSFGLSILLGGAPLLVIDLLLLAFRVLNIIQASMVMLFGGLLVVGASALIANRARTNAIHHAYIDQAEGEIAAFLDIHELSRLEFDSMAASLLPESSPLRIFLHPRPRLVENQEK